MSIYFKWKLLEALQCNLLEILTSSCGYLEITKARFFVVVCLLTHIRSRSTGKEQRLETQIIFLTHMQLLISDKAEGELGQ